MTPAKVVKQIKANRYYLLNHYLIDTAFMSFIILLIFYFSLNSHFTFTSSELILIFFIAIINGLLISSLLHNTSHANIPTNFFNRIVGEYCGYWVLYGFTNFLMVHMLHHQYADHDLDPVNPNGMTFFTFLTAPMRYMIKTTKKFLILSHGHHKDYSAIMNAQNLVFHLNLILRISIWYLILGKELFFIFYIPSFITIVGIFAHINYVCHRDHADGSVEIVNLDHNYYYKIANFLTMGGYFHKNHHLNMKIFNPRFLDSKRVSKPLLTVEAKIYLNPKEHYIFFGSKLAKYLNINNVWGEGEKNRLLTRQNFKWHTPNWL